MARFPVLLDRLTHPRLQNDGIVPDVGVRMLGTALLNKRRSQNGGSVAKTFDLSS